MDPGGAENYVYRFLKKVKIPIHIWSISQNKGAMYEKFAELGVPIIMQSIGYFNIRKSIRVLSYLRKEKIKGVVTFNGNFGGVMLLLSWIAGVKKRIAFYRRSTPAFKLTLLKSIYHYFCGRLVLLCATDILSNSNTAFANFFPDHMGRDNRFRIILNGVDINLLIPTKNKSGLRTELGIPNDVFVIGHVGRYDPAKNHETIFAVAKEICQSQSKILFLFCGLGTDSIKFKERLDYYGITEYCQCLGVTEAIGDVYCIMDIFFFPSITEGQPNALIEAMMTGLPIIASNIDSIKDTIPPDFYNKLIDPFAIDSYTAIFKQFINKQINQADYIHSDFSKNQFEVEKRFLEFYEVLNVR